MKPSSLYLWQPVCEGHEPVTVITRSLYPPWGKSQDFYSDFSLFLISQQRSPSAKPSVIIAELMFVPFPQKMTRFHSPWFCLAECAWLKTSFCLGGAQRRPRWDAVIWPDSSWSQCSFSSFHLIHLTCIRVGFSTWGWCLQQCYSVVNKPKPTMTMENKFIAVDSLCRAEVAVACCKKAPNTRTWRQE